MMVSKLQHFNLSELLLKGLVHSKMKIVINDLPLCQACKTSIRQWVS